MTVKGHKSWRVRYDFGGKEKRLLLGAYPDVSLARARELRDDAKRLLRDHREGRPANFRLTDDPPADDPHQHRWMRFRDWTPTDDPFLEAMRHVLLIDIGIWPAHWHRQSERGGYLAPSLDVWAHFHGGSSAGDWLLSDADADVSGHGMISGRVRIWSEDGRAVATGGGNCLVTVPRARSA